MPLACINLFGEDAGAVSIDGAVCGHIAVQRTRWSCRDAELHFTVLSLDPVAVPAAEASEPVAAALARLSQHLRQMGAYLVVENISALHPDVHQHCVVCRFLRLENEAGRLIWDKLLSLGLPVYGLSDQVYCELTRARPQEALENLLFGAFYCSNGLELRLQESPQGCTIHAASALEARVIVRGGMEVAQLSGTEISWSDRGNEGYVRIEIDAADGQWAWTQPRFVAGAEPQVQ